MLLHKLIKYLLIALLALPLTANAVTNYTKKQYGVKGAALLPNKVHNKKHTYQIKGKTYTSLSREASRHFSQVGVASYYGTQFHGKKTANGEIFNKNAYTAAHKTLALGTYVLVTNLRNGRKVVVRINDRGPFSQNRIIDLSAGAAKEIGMYHSGLSQVKIEALHVDRHGYISGKGTESLMKQALRAKLPLSVKGKGQTLAIKSKLAP